MIGSSNPLFYERDETFLMFEALDAERLLRLPVFSEYSRDDLMMFIAGARRFGRQVLWPSYRAVDAEPAQMVDGQVRVHPLLKQIYPQLVDLGLIAGTRPAAVGGLQLPLFAAAMAEAYLMAGNLSAYAYVGLTHGAAHLIEVFGNDHLKKQFMEPMYSGQWAGTMALTEPHAGSSLADVQTRAIPTEDGHYRIHGSKIFISGGDHDLTENIVNLTLARIDGAPAGVRGLSLLAIPKRRPAGDGASGWVDNDVRVTGVVHKIGWRGIPSLILSFGEHDDCHGWLVGEPHQGIRYMFQMMNEARLMVGLHGMATASVGYHQAVQYARERTQGRPPATRAPQSPQVPIIEHADVRRMLLRQKAIVEGGMLLVLRVAMYADLAQHAQEAAARQRAQRLLDLLTPVAKSFAAEWGYEANTLAVQVHGGYGYSSEYVPEALLRDQKLNSIHEGTTGIQSLDLLGRKIAGDEGAALALMAEEVAQTIASARQAGVSEGWCRQLAQAIEATQELGHELARRGQHDPERLLRHSFHMLTLVSIVVIAWQWLAQAAAAQEGLARSPSAADDVFYQGKLCAAQYWMATELPRADALLALCRSEDDSYARMPPAWF